MNRADGPKGDFPNAGGPPPMGRMPWTTGALLLALRAYQVMLSPLLGRACRFHPTCSQYAKDSIRTHGAALGLWYALRRLARCHPLCAGGLDPVPARRAGKHSTTGAHPRH